MSGLSRSYDSPDIASYESIVRLIEKVHSIVASPPDLKKPVTDALAVIAEAKQATAKLEEDRLKNLAVRKETAELLDGKTKLCDAKSKDLANVQTQMDEKVKAISAKETQLDLRKSVIDDKEKALSSKESDLNSLHVNLSKKSDDIVSRESAVLAKEKELAARHETLVTRETALRKLLS